MLHAEAGGHHGRAQDRTPGRVAAALDRHVLVVAERDDRGALLGPGQLEAEVASYVGQLGDQLGVTRDEADPVAGQVGALAERVQGEQSVAVLGALTAADVGVQDAHRGGVPPEVEVALVAHEQHRALAAPGHDPTQLGDVEDTAGRVARGVDPQQPRHVLGGERQQVVGPVHGDGPSTHERRADGVRRVGQRRVRDHVAGTDAEVERQRADQLLGPDDRQDLVRAQPDDPVDAGQPGDDGVAHGGPPDRQRVAGRVRLGGERPLDDLGRGVDRSPDRQVDDRSGVGRGPAPDAGERGLDGGRKTVREGGQWSWFWGGRAAMKGWSWSISPILAAPPGEPISSKNATLAV